jgi:Na+-transporting methylmalonyl-CoA/oxaloacetate decarboxylase gamma subunit
MSKMIPCFLLACMIWCVAAPAFAGSVSREPLTPAENAGLAAQQAQDADQLATVAGGDGVILVLAVVGVVFLVLYLTHNL